MSGPSEDRRSTQTARYAVPPHATVGAYWELGAAPGTGAPTECSSPTTSPKGVRRAGDAASVAPLHDHEVGTVAATASARVMTLRNEWRSDDAPFRATTATCIPKPAQRQHREWLARRARSGSMRGR